MMAYCCSSCCGDDTSQEIVSTNKPSLAVGLSEQDFLEEQDTTDKQNLAEKLPGRLSVTSTDKDSKAVSAAEVPSAPPLHKPHSPHLTMTPEPSTPRSPEKEGSIRSGSTRLADMSPEEKEAEKKRMQHMVREFAKEVVAGIELCAVDPQTGKRIKTKYVMDRYLTKFQLIPMSEEGSEGAIPIREVEMANIASLYRSADILQRYPNFPLGAEEISDTLAIATNIPPNNPQIFFIFNGRREQDKFYTCLKILRLSVDIAKKATSIERR